MDAGGDRGGGSVAGRLRCVSCGAPADSAAKFCAQCGARLPRGTPAAEYKQVTVLFADVVRSMDIAAAVGAERLREIMADTVDCCATVVRRFGGTIGAFTGDGLMAVFGAPAALEDHAVRACLAAQAIQEAVRPLAEDVAVHDRVVLRLRIGLNSGRVIAGDIGAGTFGFTTIGAHVGMAQRMESVAPPGGVMLSESTARLVEGAVQLADPEAVHIKGAAQAVWARRLIAVKPAGSRTGRRDSTLVGRSGELAALAGALDAALAGRGAVMGVVGAPGIGKSRIVGEVATLATSLGMQVFSAFCQAHTTEIPFHAATGLLRAAMGVDELDDETARAWVRDRLADADPHDLLVLDDMLGIGDPEADLLEMSPDARRRRLTALVKAMALARQTSTVYVIEDAHWIDKVSESLLTDLVSVAPQSRALVLITYRPEYDGALADVSGSETITLSALDNRHIASMVTELLGRHPSVAGFVERIGHRAAGNPFFAEEIVRDLAERGVLAGERGAYECRDEAADVAVPDTVQATIAARIDRLGANAKRTINTASVLGSRFDTELLSAVFPDVSLTELRDAELIDEIPSVPNEFVFRHPLIHAVSYESQLKSERSRLHRQVAAAIQDRDPDGADKNAALIATHLEAAGDLAPAFDWHMRAGTWLTHRDISGARMSWQRARQVADRLPTDDARRTAMRIAPRTWLCATIWRVGGSLDDASVEFDKLRDLTAASGDKRSLAIGMSGIVQLLNFYGEYTKAARLASDHVELLDSIGDPELTVGLLLVPMIAKWSAGQTSEAIHLSQRVIDGSAGDPTRGNLVVGSPLALALVIRASARCSRGISGWRQDFDEAVEIARRTDKFTFGAVVMFKYIATQSGALLAGDDALRDTAEALHIAEQFGDDFSLTNAEFTRGLVLIRRDDADRRLGFELLSRSREVALDHRNTIVAAWCVDIDVAAEKTRLGDHDTAIGLTRDVLQHEIRGGEMMNRGWCTSVLVEALLNRGGDGDLDEAQKAIDELAATPTDPGFLYHEVPLLRLNALVARARGDEDGYRAYRERYRVAAEAAGYEGHIALARAML